MIEAGEWVRCDAALDRPDYPAVRIAAQGDWRNLLRCGRYVAFLGGHRQKGWAKARNSGWVAIPDPHHASVLRNLCPRHALTRPEQLVLMPMRAPAREHTEDVALALVDAVVDGQALAAQLERTRRENAALAYDLAEVRARQQRHEALLASERAATARGEQP